MLEVAEVVRRFGGTLVARFGRMPAVLRRALAAIACCRTAVLGGQLWRCSECGADRFEYHSCRHRACPKCHGDQAREWLTSLLARLPPCPYFLATFTLPGRLRPLARRHRRVVLNALLRSASSAVLALSRDPQWLGGLPAVVAVLHTWSRDLRFHPHAHVLVSAGGLTPDGRWVQPHRDRYLAPETALAERFRAAMERALRKAGLHHLAPLGVWHTPWVVHVQHAGSGHRVLAYLARYVHRVALANSRLVAITEEAVTFRYRDGRTGVLRLCTLPPLVFLARFLDHVPPPHFVCVRYAGLLASSKAPLLEQARALLGASTAPPATTASRPAAARCPVCHTGTLVLIGPLPPRRGPP